jgi:hypothetical protein
LAIGFDLEWKRFLIIEMEIQEMLLSTLIGLVLVYVIKKFVEFKDLPPGIFTFLSIKLKQNLNY